MGGVDDHAQNVGGVTRGLDPSRGAPLTPGDVDQGAKVEREAARREPPGLVHHAIGMGDLDLTRDIAATNQGKDRLAGQGPKGREVVLLRRRKKVAKRGQGRPRNRLEAVKIRSERRKITIPRGRSTTVESKKVERKRRRWKHPLPIPPRKTTTTAMPRGSRTPTRCSKSVIIAVARNLLRHPHHPRRRLKHRRRLNAGGTLTKEVAGAGIRKKRRRKEGAKRRRRRRRRGRGRR